MLFELLARSAERHPDRPALVQGERRFSYRELLGAARGLAALFRSRGLERGRRVALQIPNSAEFAGALFALFDLGVSVLPLDPALKPPETATYCEQAGVEVVLRPTGGEQQVPEPLTALSVPALDSLGATGVGEDGQGYDPHQPAMLFLSSGTTGRPKIVVRTEEIALALLRLASSALRIGPDDRALPAVPFFHSYGLSHVLLNCVRRGGSVHLEPFSPRGFMRTVERAGITVLATTPFVLHVLAETKSRRPPRFESVRLVTTGGAPLSRGVAGAFERRFGVRITRLFGVTEAGMVAAGLPGDQREEPGWVGRPLAGVQVRVLGPDLQEIGPGERGQLAVRSPAMMAGYLDRPEETARVLHDGFFLTGDLGSVSADGDLFVLGRLKRMISVAGKKVSPAEVEACLRLHPAVAEAQVSGVPTPDGDERVRALVVPVGEVDDLELRRFLADRLADFKIPRDFAFARSIPRAALGKPKQAIPQAEAEGDAQ